MTVRCLNKLNFILEVTMKFFFTRCALLALDNENENFLDFLSGDYSSRIMRESKISIHIETGNVYFENLNTGESLYDFLQNQQDQKKKLIDASFSYGGSFSECLTEFLKGIDAEADDRFDMLTNKNVKYLFYGYNDFLLSKGLPTAVPDQISNPKSRKRRRKF